MAGNIMHKDFADHQRQRAVHASRVDQRKACIPRLKLWKMQRCVSLSHPRTVHQRVGAGPVSPASPPIMPPIRPAMPSAMRPPAEDRLGIAKKQHRRAVNNQEKCRPNSRNTVMLTTPSRVVPMGTPMRASHQKWHQASSIQNCAARTPRDSICATNEPKTPIGARSLGSMCQTQKLSATKVKAKPATPETKPPAQVPAMIATTTAVVIDNSVPGEYPDNPV